MYLVGERVVHIMVEAAGLVAYGKAQSACQGIRQWLSRLVQEVPIKAPITRTTVVRNPPRISSRHLVVVVGQISMQAVRQTVVGVAQGPVQEERQTQTRRTPEATGTAVQQVVVVAVRQPQAQMPLRVQAVMADLDARYLPAIPTQAVVAVGRTGPITAPEALVAGVMVRIRQVLLAPQTQAVAVADHTLARAVVARADPAS